MIFHMIRCSLADAFEIARARCPWRVPEAAGKASPYLAFRWLLARDAPFFDCE